MCRATRCTICGKTTWAGCGQHVDQVMARVPRADRCPGHGDTEAQAPAAPRGGLVGRLLGRS